MLKHLRLFSLLFVFATFAFGQESDSPPSQALINIAASSFHEYDRGNTFDSILASGPNVPSTVIIPETYDAASNGAVFPPSDYPSDLITGLVRTSGFVGVGNPIKRWTYPTDGNRFTVSIYLVHVSDVIVGGKDRVASGQDIYIARAGGPVQYKGHTFRGIETNFQLFHLNEPYIFFGQRIGSDLYKVDAEHSLKIEGSNVIETSTRKYHTSHYSGRSASSILREALDASQQIASSKRRQP